VGAALTTGASVQQGSAPVTCAHRGGPRKGLAGVPRRLQFFIRAAAGGARANPSPTTAACNEQCCSGGVLPASWAGEGSSTASDSVPAGVCLAPKAEWFGLPAAATQPTSTMVLPVAVPLPAFTVVPPVAQAAAADVQPPTPAASGAAAAAPTPQQRAAACAAAVAPARRRRGSGKSQTAPFGFSESKCCVIGWKGPLVTLVQKRKGRPDRTVRLPPFCPCGCGIPPFSEKDWEKYLSNSGAPKKDDLEGKRAAGR
jgi:hypothetical protein